MGIEQIERRAAVKSLVLLAVVDVTFNDRLLPRGTIMIRRVAAETNADVVIGLAIHDHLCGDFHVRHAEVLQFLFPVLVFELQEDRANDVGIVQVPIGIGCHIGRGQLLAGRGRLPSRATERTTATGTADRVGLADFRQGLPTASSSGGPRSPDHQSPGRRRADRNPGPPNPMPPSGGPKTGAAKTGAAAGGRPSGGPNPGPSRTTAIGRTETRGRRNRGRPGGPNPGPPNPPGGPPKPPGPPPRRQVLLDILSSFGPFVRL